MPAHPRERLLRLWPRPESVAQARDFVRESCRRLGLPVDTVDNVVLVTSELVTNCVRHAHSMITLALAADDGRVGVAVTDEGEQQAAADGQTDDQDETEDEDTLAEHGRGLHLVEALTSAWGIREGGPGKTVWGRLP